MNAAKDTIIQAAGVSTDGHPINQPKPLRWRKLWDLPTAEEDTGSELLKHRFLCRGGGALLVAPTGVGKSVAEIQAACQWALGQPFFGIIPARPLRSLIIQAENDDGDLREMRDGVFNGLGLTPEERECAGQSVIIATESSRTSTEFFLEVVEPLLQLHHPDLLWIDPAFAYLGGQAAQEVVTTFLRNGLNPLLHKYGSGAFVVHHTNKPQNGKDRPDWQASDFSYLGSGSSEWANWARAILAIRSLGSHDVYELRAAKRGKRLGWKDEDGNPAYFKLIAHAKEPGVICWREAETDEIPTRKGVTKQTTRYDLLALVPETGSIDKYALESKAMAAGVGEKRTRGLLAELLEAEQAFEWRIRRKGVRPAIRISRHPQQEVAHE